MKVILMGFMCSGKSLVGKIVSDRLGWTYIDTDRTIEEKEGQSVADIIKSKGEKHFRQIESQMIKDVAKKDKCVISTGGGAPLNPENLKILTENSESVWLQVSADTVLKRAGDLKSRPLIDSKKPLASVKKLLKEREKAYSSARHKVDTDELNPGQVATKVLDLILEIQN